MSRVFDHVSDLELSESGFTALACDAGEVFHDAALVGADEDVGVRVGFLGGGEGGGEFGALDEFAAEFSGAVLADVDDDVLTGGG